MCNSTKHVEFWGWDTCIIMYYILYINGTEENSKHNLNNNQTKFDQNKWFNILIFLKDDLPEKEKVSLFTIISSFIHTFIHNNS